MLVTGPMATTWKGTPTTYDSPLELPEWKPPAPSAPNPPPRSFATGAPVAASVATNSRTSWDALQGKAASRLPTLLSKVPILVNPDARTLAGYICVCNPSGSDTSSLLEANPLISKRIWVPDTPSDASTATTPLVQTDAQTTTDWGTLSDPPSPLEPSLWSDPNPTLAGKGTVNYTLLDSFALTDDPVPADAFPAPTDDDLGGWFLLPQFLALPQGHSLPIGLIVDPKDMEIDTFISILSGLAPPNLVDFYNWLASPLLTVWFKAVSRRPSAFAAPFLPWETWHAAVAPTDTSPLRYQVSHIQRSLAHHLLVDHVLASAKSAAMYEKFSLHFQHCLADSITHQNLRLSYWARRTTFSPPPTSSPAGSHPRAPGLPTIVSTPSREPRRTHFRILFVTSRRSWLIWTPTELPSH